MQVRLGGYAQDSDSPSDFEERRAVRVVWNRRFNHKLNADHMNNDVALLLLDTPSTMPTVGLAPYKGG